MAGQPPTSGPRLAGRLTADLVLSAPQGFNAVKDYSISLRGADQAALVWRLSAAACLSSAAAALSQGKVQLFGESLHCFWARSAACGVCIYRSCRTRWPRRCVAGRCGASSGFNPRGGTG